MQALRLSLKISYSGMYWPSLFLKTNKQTKHPPPKQNPTSAGQRAISPSNPMFNSDYKQEMGETQ